MAVELDRFQNMNNYITLSRTAIEDQLVRILQSQSDSAIRRTGHARFRRGPSDQSTTSTSSSYDDQSAQNQFKTKHISEQGKSTVSSLISLIAGEEATVSNGKLELLATGVAPIARIYSSAKPPLPSSHRKRSREVEQVLGDRLRSQGCHCCKRRKKIEITRRIRIKKGSSSTIPSDEFSWKKYDQKLITGTSSRGGYYKCSSVNGCSARKHVIKDHNDPTVLIVTYKGEHNHRLPEILTKLNGGDLSYKQVKSR